MTDIETNDCGMVDIDDVIIRSTLIVDDGCDWTAHHVWRMNTRRRMRNGIYEPPPDRPKVSEIKLTPIKKPKKKRQRKAEVVD
ncbi:hypothetical protein EKN56_12785 [Limnobaculum zhutongyuii]|uniref:Uncharacterized protein n=1 Tax=Limnobaculum zhutongyuii TaxID=2498113 RepID=A0A411WLY2_9GAMM|nr:hypothetical protein [Limnobaculum zhutongyuii]QBH97192.1 hypothetical protein EKN56_12785 [Limnobaculum zhutongyuii]TQS88451.1 hypothetical protein ELQ32_10570 [Limnobaculum zhutongyuii]